jgi:hypothetical protein
MAIKSGSVEISTYYMSLQFGLCQYDPNLKLIRLFIGDKEVFDGQLPDTNGGCATLIDDRDAFGGYEKEGGVEGKLWFMDGRPTQLVPASIAAKENKTPTTMTGYRGFASIFLTEPDVTDLAEVAPSSANIFGNIKTKDNERPSTGFYLAANNPYLKDIRVRVRRASTGLNPAKALFVVAQDKDDRDIYASNAAHIIFECFTNKDWGMGEDVASCNMTSWEAASDTLFTEKFGLNILWSRQMTIEEFTDEILNLIQGKIDINPETGLYELNLFRADYNIGSLPEINENNAVLTNFKTQTWGNIKNEMVVKYTDPKSGETESVTAQDSAAIAMQGGITSETRDYYAINDETLAMTVVERDLSMVVYPFMACDAEVTRAFWKTLVGDVVKLNWPSRGISAAYFRVGKVTRGSSNRTVKLALYEDMFSVSKGVYLESAGTDWVDPSQEPQPLTYYKFGTLPAFFTVAAAGLSDISDLSYPLVMSASIAAADTSDDIGYDLLGYTTNALGQVIQKSFGKQPLRTSWKLSAAITQQNSSTISIPTTYYGAKPVVGDFVLFGNGADETTELGIVTAVSATTLTVARGIMDTTPKDWVTNSRVWFIPASSIKGDTRQHSAFESVDYQLLTRTSKGVLSSQGAAVNTVVLGERPHLPLRPSYVRVNNNQFGPITAPTGSALSVSWRRRNRVSEATQVFLWNDADTTAEPGQTTSVYLLHKVTRALLASYEGYTGVSMSIPWGSFSNYSSGVIVFVTSKRDGFESLQGHEIIVDFV